MSQVIPSSEKMPRAMWEFNLLKKALEKNGEPAQLNQLQEELAELIVSINHFRRGRIAWVNVCEEMADVLIMIGEFESIGDNAQIIHKEKEKKLLRLAERLK